HVERVVRLRLQPATGVEVDVGRDDVDVLDEQPVAPLAGLHGEALDDQWPATSGPFDAHVVDAQRAHDDVPAQVDVVQLALGHHLAGQDAHAHAAGGKLVDVDRAAPQPPGVP